MENQNKPRIIKDYEKLNEEIQEQIKLAYPRGFSKNLISFTNREGKKVSALPFETEDKYYLVRMSISEAKEIILQDDDYNDLGILKSDVREEYEEKYTDPDSLIDGEDDYD